MYAIQPEGSVRLLRQAHVLRLAVALALVLTAFPRWATASPAARIRVQAVPAEAGNDCALVQPCFLLFHLLVTNEGAETWELDSVVARNLNLPRAEGIVSLTFEPTVIPTGGSWLMPRPLRLHIEGKYEAEVILVSSKGTHVRVKASLPKVPWIELAKTQCAGCTTNTPGNQAATCTCATHDAGKVCRKSRECEGVCIFRRTEPVPEEHDCPRGAQCLWTPKVVAVGNCSSLRTPPGCVDVIPMDAEPTERYSSGYRCSEKNFTPKPSSQE